MTRRTIVYGISILALCLTLGAAWVALREGEIRWLRSSRPRRGLKRSKKLDKPQRRRKLKPFSNRPPKCSAIGSPNTTSTSR